MDRPSTGSSSATAWRIAAVAAFVCAAVLFPLAVSYSADIPIATVAVGNTPAAIAVNPLTHRVFVCNYFGDSVSVIDGVSDAVTATVAMPTTGAAAALPIAAISAPTLGLTYIANWQSHKVVYLAEPAYNATVVVTVPFLNGGNPRALAVDPASTPPKLYVANYHTNNVSVLNAVTGALITEVPVGGSPRALGIYSSGGSTRIFVGNRATNNVSVIDGATDSVIATLALDGPPKTIAVHAGNGKAYVTVPASDHVFVIGAADTIVATITVGDNPVGIAVRPDLDVAMVADYLSNRVTVIDTVLDSVTATRAVGPGPFSVTPAPLDNKWYVTNKLGSTVNVLDGTYNVTTVAVGTEPFAVAVDESLSPREAYCTNYASDTVTVIDEPLAVTSGSGMGVAHAAGGPTSPRVAVAADPLPGNVTTEATHIFTGSADATTFPESFAVLAAWYALDSETEWHRAEITSGAGTPSVRWRAEVGPLATGSHTLRVVAMDQGIAAASSTGGQEGLGGGSGSSGPFVDEPATYAFTYVDASSDTTPPVTSVSGVPGGWSSTDVTVTLTATDTGGSGVASTWYSLDGGAPQLYTLPFGLSTPGTTTVACWSIDVAANTETSHSADVRIDKTPPATTSDAAASYVGTATVHLSATDALSGLAGTAYNLDGSGWTTATTVVTTVTGGHTLQYRSVDAAGNLESPGSVAFTIVAGSVADVPTGTDVVVTTPEGVTFEFDEVTSAGTVTVAHTGSGPQLPGNFRLARGAYYDISVSASFSGFVTITLPYDENAIVGKEKNLKLFHRTSAGRWEDITVSVDTAANTITGRTSSFSPFGVGYSPWEPTSTANIGSLPTPHKGYTVSTNKCAVCHSAHKSEPTGEVLLGVPAADACSFCHIETGIGIRRIYDATTTAYAIDSSVTAFGGGFAHTKDSVICQDCHSVHGARTLDGGNIAKILKDWTYWRDAPGGFTDYSTLALAKWSNPATVAVKYDQQSAWCTGCHKYFTESYDTSAAAVQYFDGTGWAFAGSHVMTSAPKAYGNPHRTMEGTVAFAPTATCRTCHNAGAVDTTGGTVTNSFPHYTPDFYRFMGVGASVAETASANTTGTVDGLCLKCHRDGTGEGVGLGF
ncbi:MAG: hypothetical protein C0418_05280 [Coriobacteriaceae bacterium]|nr:hypothetical protein [Coriobacteriaceae bacterium]